jgi:hypothetical protein
MPRRLCMARGAETLGGCVCREQASSRRPAPCHPLTRRHCPAVATGWSGIFGVGTAAGPRTVIARADSFTGPPRAAMPFNLENDDAESVESVRPGLLSNP